MKPPTTRYAVIIWGNSYVSHIHEWLPSREFPHKLIGMRTNDGVCLLPGQAAHPCLSCPHSAHPLPVPPLSPLACLFTCLDFPTPSGLLVFARMCRKTLAFLPVIWLLALLQSTSQLLYESLTNGSRIPLYQSYIGLDFLPPHLQNTSHSSQNGPYSCRN